MERVISTRFQVLEPTSLAPDTVRLRVKDLFTGSEATLFEWTPQEGRFEESRAILANTQDELGHIGCWTAESRLYLQADTDQTTEAALKLLRERGLFLGDWHVISPSAPEKPPELPELPAPPAPDEELPGEPEVAGRKWGRVLIPLASVALIAIVVVLALYPRDPRGEPIIVGYYESLGYVPTRLGAGIVHDEDGLQFEFIDVGNVKDNFGYRSDLRRYDLILLPLSSLARMSIDRLAQQFSIVWLPSRTSGDDYILSESEIGKSLYDLAGGQIAIVDNTPAAISFESFIDKKVLNDADLAETIKRRIQPFDDPASMQEATKRPDSKFSAVVVSEPYATLLTSSKYKHRTKLETDHLYVLLCRKQRFFSAQPVKDKSQGWERNLRRIIAGPGGDLTPLQVLARLIEGSDAVAKEQTRQPWKSVARLKELELFRTHPLDEYQEIGKAYSNVEMEVNFQFLTNSGPSSCLNELDLLAYKGAPPNAVSNICGMLSTSLLKEYLLRRQLSAQEVESICSPQRSGPSRLVGSLSNFVSGQSYLPQAPWEIPSGGSTIADLHLPDNELYCVIGHTDMQGEDARNRSLGNDRARTVIDNLPHDQRVYLPFSRGSRDSTRPESGQDRKVEIKRVFNDPY